ncbi:MAG: histidine kinase [Coriobacteriia bacterium]|nr:histidine kinase [Coriobacteriia bacterium]
MERVLDKAVLFALSAFLAASLPFTIQTIIAVLLAISASALFDVDTIPRRLRVLTTLAYIFIGFFIPPAAIFLPLVCYDCFRIAALLPSKQTARLAQASGGFSPYLVSALRFAWVFPLGFCLLTMPVQTVLLIGLLCVLACLRAWQSESLAKTLDDYRDRRDELAASARSLEVRNRDLEDRQTLELQLATLAERSRIAREIHDNVGHLLTRSVLQVEAMQVQHASDTGIVDQLSEVGSTLKEAYESVRSSVHELHEEAFDLHLQLQALAQQTEQVQRSPSAFAAGEAPPLQVRLNYELQTDPPPQAFSYSVLAIVREALANTIKHSDATLLEISLREFPGFYQLTAYDNGTLAPPVDFKAGGGIGLANMEERARALGGVLNARYDHGFKVFASIPKEL